MKKEDDIRKNLSEKFKDFEAQPQDDSWESIRFALDMKEKLDTYEAEPQPKTWSEINLANHLRGQFSDFEAEPQNDSWAKIQLATQLSEKFRNYEAEPKAETWQKIKAAIKQDDDDRVIFFPFIYRVGIAASIALLLGFGWLLYNNNQTKQNNYAVKKQTQKIGNQTIINQENTKVEDLANNKTNTGGDKNGVENGVSTIPNSEKNLKEFSVEKVASNRTSDISKQRNDAKKATVKKDNVLKNNLPKTPFEQIVQQEVLVSNKNTETKNTVSTNEIEIGLLESKGFKARNARFPFGVIAYNNERPMEEKRERVKRNIVLTTSLMPLQTYQALTILPQTNTYVQQVGTLNALDAQRLGLQARVGLMKPISNRFSTGASLTYSGIRQAVSYEVNSGTYDLQATDNQNYTLVGVGETVSQNKFLHTVGLKIDNSYLVSNKKNKIFVLGGAEAVRVLNNNDYAFYLNASVAISYPTKSGKSIWIEPTYRYSLSQSLDSFSYLQIRPSNIGLNVRVNFM
jgi:hypothetical protein